LRRRSNARRGKNAPAISLVALEAVKHIDALFDIERNINGLSAEERLRVRQERSAPILAALEAWLREERSRLSRSASVAKPIELALALLGLGDGGWIGVSAFVKQAALRPRLQVLRRTRSCRRTSGYCPLWSWHPPLRIEERDDGAKAALLQSFADNGVRPVLRGRIKSNQFPEMGPALLGPAVNLTQQT
jgi:Transposase IS66 family